MPGGSTQSTGSGIFSNAEVEEHKARAGSVVLVNAIQQAMLYHCSLPVNPMRDALENIAEISMRVIGKGKRAAGHGGSVSL